jgi:hypothetical protein
MSTDATQFRQIAYPQATVLAAAIDGTNSADTLAACG